MSARQSPRLSTPKRTRRPQTAFRTSHLMRRLQGALSLDLLHPSYPPDQISYEEATRGHCYIATEALYHFFGRRAGFVPYVHNHGRGTHWWLVKEETGEILDPTEPQLLGDRSIYDKGHRGSFLTRKPSRRATELIRRLRRT